MKVAVVHDWLETYAGAERVLHHILALYPSADLFVLVDHLAEADRGFLRGHKIETSLIQKLPFARGHFRKYLALFPYAVEQFDLSGYDLAISSSFCVAKGAVTGPDQVHVCYIHSPVRYAWDLQHQYLEEAGIGGGLLSFPVRWTLHRLRQSDVASSNGVDRYVANSHFVARRVRKFYRRDAEVVYPPVAVEDIAVERVRDDHYVTVSRLVPYKRVELVVRAFQAMPDRRLVVIGDGPDFARISRLAGGNVEMMGYQPTEMVRKTVGRARAFLFAGAEDFGIAMVEAQAAGTPLIAYGRGGAAEIVRGAGDPAPTGLLFEEQSTRALVDAIESFEGRRDAISPDACRANAERFAASVFRQGFAASVATALAERSEGGPRSPRRHSDTVERLTIGA